MSSTEREIIVIPASESLSFGGRKNRQMRVASYSRVSTDFEEQLTSFHAQKSYYTDLIMRTPEWTLAGISRLDYGTKYCRDSVTLDEDSLHAAVMQAINDTRGSRRELIPFVTAHFSRTLREDTQGEVDAEQLEARIAQLKAQTMELVAQSISSNTVGENEGRLKAMSDEIKALCDMLAQYRQSCNAENGVGTRMAEIAEILENEPEQSDTYDDTLVRQLIDTIRVVGENKLEIIFRRGLTYEQKISPKVRKLVRVS